MQFPNRRKTDLRVGWMIERTIPTRIPQENRMAKKLWMMMKYIITKIFCLRSGVIIRFLK